MTTRGVLEWRSRQGAGLVNEDGDFLKVNVLNEFRLWVTRNDVSLTPSLLESGYWESWITVWVANYLSPGMTFVDIGANFGYYTMLANNIVGPTGRVVAYEANPAIAELLERTKSDNQALFEIRNVAAADKAGTLTLSYPGDYTGSASVVIDFEDHAWGEPHHIEVPAVTLDSENLGHVDLIKIDAESAEEIVWNGARSLLYRADPPTVMLEYSPTGHYSEAWKDEILGHGKWDAYTINTSGDLEEIDRAFVDGLTDWNMLVLRPCRP